MRRRRGGPFDFIPIGIILIYGVYIYCYRYISGMVTEDDYYALGLLSIMSILYIIYLPSCIRKAIESLETTRRKR